MEKNQQITDTESAMEDMALQDTLRIGETEQEEIERELRESVERSMTELQWQQQLNIQEGDSDAENTDTRTLLQKVRDQEGREIKSRLQKRWQNQKQKENESGQTEVETKKGGRQHPPTQITKKIKILGRLRLRKIKPQQRETGNYRT